MSARRPPAIMDGAPAKPVRVRTEHAGQEAYLLKVPEHVYRRCLDADAGEHIGDIELGPAPAGGAGLVPLRFHVGEIHTDKVDAPPTTCEVRPQPAQEASVYAFAGANGGLALTGKVCASGIVQMPMGGAMMSMLQKRKADAAVPKRTAQAYERGDADATLTAIGRAPAEKKRTLRGKMDPEELRAKLLALFSQRPYLSIQEVVAATDQVEEHVRAVLQQVCNSTGPSGENRHKWELKPEYRG